MTLYGEGFLLMNYGMDFLCLLGTARFLNLPLKPKRICLGALMGAFYSVLAVCRPALHSLWGLLIISFLMSAAAFSRHMIRGAAGVWLIGLCTSGLASALAGFLPWDWANLCACAVFALSFCLFPPGKPSAESGEVRFSRGEKMWTVPAVADTGNLLKDNVTGLPVIVVPLSACRDIMPENMHTLPSGMRLIRAQTAAGKVIMPCFHPDCVHVRFTSRVRDVQAIVALAPGEMPCALVPPGALK